KIQWVDEATGLDCLMVRNSGGAWCGYVGVSEGHPLYGVEYSAESLVLTEALERLKTTPIAELEMTFARNLAVLLGEIRPSPDVVIGVHGGLTYSGHGHEPTEEQWRKIPERL